MIVKEYLKSLEQIDYWVLNVSAYTAANKIKQLEIRQRAENQNSNAEQKERNASGSKILRTPLKTQENLQANSQPLQHEKNQAPILKAKNA